MTNDALIRGKVHQLSPTELEAASKFHKSRVPFAWVDGKLIFNIDSEDDRDHQHWLLDEFGITPEEFEHIPRGYMIEERIQLFIGSEFKPMNTNNIKIDDFLTLRHKHHDLFNSNRVTIYNGVKIGKIGEIWDPIEVVGTFETT